MVRVISLQDLLDKASSEEEVKEILYDFKSVSLNHENIHDVERFLHEKSITFEKIGLATTHIIISDNLKILGYFSLANKPLILGKDDFELLSNSKRKKLLGLVKKEELEKHIVISSYLIGQLGKNYNSDSSISGLDILTIAYDYLLNAKRIVNARNVWIECEDNEKVIEFYKSFGFEKLENFKSPNGLNVLIMRLKE